MYRTKLENPQARKAAAQCLRVARDTFKRPDEVFGFAITIAANLKTIERKAGNWDSGNAYRDAERALNRAN